MNKNDKRNKNNVISIEDKLERWQRVYTSPCESFYVNASTRGALKVNFSDSDKSSIHLDFIESVRFMSEVSKGFEDMMMDTLDAL